LSAAAPESASITSATVCCPLCLGAVDRTNDRRVVKQGLLVVGCPTCGLVFRADLPDSDELRGIYGEDYFVAATGPESGGQGYLDYTADETTHRRLAARRVRSLQRFVGTGRLLDVGCAAGFFLDEARRVGYDVEGVDVAPSMVAWGRDTLHLHIREGRLADCELPPSGYTVVTMWDYIEHSLDPVSDLRRAASALEYRGVLALSTGDIGSLVARLSGSRWHLMTPRHHNFYFSAPTLERALGEAGFDLLEQSHPGASFPLRYLSHKARTMLDVPPTRAVATWLERSPLGAIELPVNLRDVITVVARKRA
jgi:SAM-dependent methyltransferase